MKTNTRFDTKSLVLLGLLTAIVMLFAFTPIGSIPIGPLVITLNVIPVAIAAMALGPIGGAIVGGVFGLLSFLQCFGIGVPSGMGAILAGINPFLAFVQRFVPRVLDGLLVGFISRGMTKIKKQTVCYIITGAISALFSVALFMSALTLISSFASGSIKLVTPIMLIAYIVVGSIGFVLGYKIVSAKKLSVAQATCSVTGFCTAFLNTALFMTALVVLFGSTDYMKETMAGKNVLLFIVTFVGVNALFEMVVTTVVASAIGAALIKARLINNK